MEAKTHSKHLNKGSQNQVKKADQDWLLEKSFGQLLPVKVMFAFGPVQPNDLLKVAINRYSLNILLSFVDLTSQFFPLHVCYFITQL